MNPRPLFRNTPSASFKNTTYNGNTSDAFSNRLYLDSKSKVNLVAHILWKCCYSQLHLLRDPESRGRHPANTGETQSISTRSRSRRRLRAYLGILAAARVLVGMADTCKRAQVS